MQHTTQHSSFCATHHKKRNARLFYTKPQMEVKWRSLWWHRKFWHSMCWRSSLTPRSLPSEMIIAGMIRFTDLVLGIGTKGLVWPTVVPIIRRRILNTDHFKMSYVTTVFTFKSSIYTYLFISIHVYFQYFLELLVPLPPWHFFSRYLKVKLFEHHPILPSAGFSK